MRVYCQAGSLNSDEAIARCISNQSGNGFGQVMETVNSLYSKAADQAPQVMRPYLGNRLEQDNRIRRQGKHVQDRPLENPRHLFKRSEEHTSELQSLMRISYAVFCLKKKNVRYGYKSEDIRR